MCVDEPGRWLPMDRIASLPRNFLLLFSIFHAYCACRAAAAEVASFTFRDSLDASHSLQVEAGQLKWCQEEALFGCEPVQQLDIDLLPGQQFALQAGWRRIVIADPPPGQLQFDRVAGLARACERGARRVRLAGDAGAAVAKLASASSQGSSPRPQELGEPDVAQDQEFPLPLRHAPSQASSVAYFRVRGSFAAWDPTRLCVKPVEDPEKCNSFAFLEPCTSTVIAASSPDQFLGFQLPRPEFVDSPQTLEEAENLKHSLCLWVAEYSHVPLLLGRLQYHPYPFVRYIRTPELIGVRTFLNPGWSGIVEAPCRNCSGHNRVTLRAVTLEASCRQRVFQEQAIRAAAFQAHQIAALDADLLNSANEYVKSAQDRYKNLYCRIPERSPCEGYVDGALDIGTLASDRSPGLRVSKGAKAQNLMEGITPFSLNASHRLSADEKRRYFHHFSVLCFYPNDAYPNGTMLGIAMLHMDGHDLQAFVAFVCFFGVVLPLVCMVTALLHLNKQERAKQHLHEVRLLLQREQLEREMRGELPAPRSVQTASAAEVSRSNSRETMAAMRDVVAGGSSSSTSLVTPLVAAGLSRDARLAHMFR